MKHHSAHGRVVHKKQHNPHISFFSAVGWVFVCEFAGVVGSIFTVGSIPTWYQTLVKPSFNPPNWIFGPVWTTLYALMGISVYRIWRLGMHREKVRDAVVLFCMHLVLNAVWSPVFFGARNIPIAFAIIAIMWLTLIALIFRFERLDKVSAYMLTPYLAWISFAMILNYNLWILNP